jgi:hypothetical protein
MAAVRLGLLRLTDAAPVVLAEAAGLYAAEDLDVRLSVEPSWANLADKLSYGLLDAAIMLPPLALAVSLGLRAAGAKLIVPMGLSLNGNGVTLSAALAGQIPAGLSALDAPGDFCARCSMDGRRALRSCMRARPIICCCAIGWRRAASIPTARSP